jgi:YgiT-type zinc finger domain-containing protein
MITMKCHYCQGEMKKGTAPYHVDRTGYHLSFDKVPAWICSQCGQSYFEEHEVDEIQNAVRELDEHASKVLSPA